MTFRASYPSFAGGEVSEAVAARWDVAKYTTALSLARNTLGFPQGGQYAFVSAANTISVGLLVPTLGLEATIAVPLVLYKVA